MTTPPAGLPLINWRLTVRDWDGTYRHERYASHTDPDLQVNIPESGLEVTRSGYGDCLELTFAAIWTTLRARGRDLLELDTQDTSGAWTRRWAGVVVKSGNAQVSWAHTNFKAAGLRKRFGEVRVPADLAEGDVGAQARQALQLVLDSGQLGTSVTLDPALIPDAGVKLGVVQARDRTLADIYDYLAAQGARVWGVNEHRAAFWRPAATGEGDVLNLAETITDPARAVVATFEDATAEALITRVLFNVGAWEDGTRITHEVRSEHEARYGVSWKEVPLDPSVPNWATVPFLVTTNNVAAPRPAELARLVDHQSTDGLGARAGWDIYRTSRSAPGSITLVTTGPMQRMPIDARWENVQDENWLDCRLTITAAGSVISQSVTGRYDARTSRVTIQDMVERRGPDPLPAGTRFTFDVPENVVLNLAEARPEIINAPLLEQLAAYHLVLPSRDPASVRVPWPVTPRPTLSLRRLLGDTYEAPVEVVRLMIKLDEPGVTVIQTGQRESAEAAGQRFLARQALQEATLAAIRAARTE